MSKKICVIGLGYIGLPTSVMFASHGFRVVGVDINERIVNMINQKQVHIEEPGLEERLTEVVDNGMLTASIKPETADIFIIAVPSPINEDKSANLDYVRSASESIAKVVQKGNLIILESTVPPRTVEDIVIPELVESGLEIGTDLLVSHSPERVIPGKLFEELVNNDRIVGGINDKSSQMTKELYETFVKGTIHITDATTAEMVKVMENTYRDVNIALANELARIADNIGVDAWEAIKLANFHPRVNLHLPGPGVGGHCIAVDPWFIVDQEPDLAKIIKLARNTNDGMPAYTAQKAIEILKESGIEQPKISVFGLAFKGNIDDMRESPSLEVIHALEHYGIEYMAYDPHIKENQLEKQTQSIDDALEGSDLILVLTDHQMFRDLSPESCKAKMRTPIVFDTKNCIEPNKWKSAGFSMYRLGDSKTDPSGI